MPTMTLTYDATAKVYRSDKDGSTWSAIRRGTGEVTSFVEVFKAGAGYCSVPGASRFVRVND